MNGIVLPSSTLLDTDASPFRFRQETALGERLGELLWKNDVTVDKSIGHDAVNDKID